MPCHLMYASYFGFIWSDKLIIALEPFVHLSDVTGHSISVWKKLVYTFTLMAHFGIHDENKVHKNKNNDNRW